MKHANSVITGVMLAAGTLGCSTDKTTSQSDQYADRIEQSSQKRVPHEGLTALEHSGVKFIDQNGDIIDWDAEKRKVAGKNSSISFQYGNCSAYCPATVTALNTLAESDPNLINFVISSFPKEDFQSSTLETRMDQNGLKNTRYLYPTITGSQEDLRMGGANKSTDELAIQVQTAHTALNRMYKKKFGKDGHTGVIMLYGRDGKKTGESLDKDPLQMAKELEEHLQPEPQKGAASLR